METIFEVLICTFNWFRIGLGMDYDTFNKGYIISSFYLIIFERNEYQLSPFIWLVQNFLSLCNNVCASWYKIWFYIYTKLYLILIVYHLEVYKLFISQPTWSASTKSACTDSRLLFPPSKRRAGFANSTFYSNNAPGSNLSSGTTQAITFRPFTISRPSFA